MILTSQQEPANRKILCSFLPITAVTWRGRAKGYSEATPETIFSANIGSDQVEGVRFIWFTGSPAEPASYLGSALHSTPAEIKVTGSPQRLSIWLDHVEEMRGITDGPSSIYLNVFELVSDPVLGMVLVGGQNLQCILILNNIQMLLQPLDSQTARTGGQI
ncbi:hypothetical protein QOT17_013459 [Balamuthia mandrillaris]